MNNEPQNIEVNPVASQKFRCLSSLVSLTSTFDVPAKSLLMAKLQGAVDKHFEFPVSQCYDTGARSELNVI